jgi:hypothetical protein
MKADTRPVMFKIAADLDVAFRAFCAGRGSTMTDELQMALRRHMASPPPMPEVVPLPPVRPVGRPRKAT